MSNKKSRRRSIEEDEEENGGGEVADVVVVNEVQVDGEEETTVVQDDDNIGGKENTANVMTTGTTTDVPASLTEKRHSKNRLSTTSTSSSSSSSNNNTSICNPGIIKTIYVENFMCHHKLRIDLNKNITFIHGQNGSGKSAILAAIQICLGANARRTHRARNLKDLIRRDSATSAASQNAVTCAKVRVTIYNNHPTDSYHPEIYGKTITIERIISLNNSSDHGYKLLDENMHVQSKSKKDLDDLLDTLNIQVENPVAVLDQEEAKKFLTGKAEDKYAFFMKATELERVDRTYANTLDTITELQDMNIRVKDTLQVQYDHVQSLKQKYLEQQELSKLQHKKLCLGNEYAWSLYNEIQTTYDQHVDAKQQVLDRIQKKEEEIRKAEEEANTNGDDGTNPETMKRNRVDKLLQEAQNQANHKHQIEEQLKLAQGPIRQIDREIASVQKSYNAAKKQLRTTQTTLEETRAQILALTNSAESEEVRLTTLLQQQEEALAEARSQVDALKQKKSTWLRKFEEIEPHVREATSRVEQQKKQIHAVRSTLQSLQNSDTASNVLTLLGPRVAAVTNMVQRYKEQNKFRGTVVGPIGCYIKVAEGMNDFAAVAEHAIGGTGTLDRFIVCNDHDATLLRQIRKQAGCFKDCNIFQMHPTTGRYDIPGSLGMDGIERVSNVLSFENDLVFNCLIDNSKMERKAVARDRKHSQEMLLVKNGHKYSIREKILEVYLPTGDQWTVRNGSLAMFSNENKLRQTIGIDRTAAIADAQAQLVILEEEMRSMKQRESKLQHEHTSAQKAWADATEEAKKNSSLTKAIIEGIESIKEEMKALTNPTTDTTEMEEDIQQAENLMARHKATEEQLIADREGLLPQYNDLKAQLEECSKQNHNILEEIALAERELTQFLETQTQQNDKLAKKRQKLQKYQADLGTLNEQINLITVRRDDYLLKARTMHFRVQQEQALSSNGDGDVNIDVQPSETIRTDPTDEELEAIEPITVKHEPTWYEHRLTKLEEKIQTEKHRRNVTKNDDPATVYERYVRAKNELKEKTDQVTQTDERIAELTKDVDIRRKRWRQFRKHLAKSTALKFDEMLAMNKYTGTLEFDDENLTLDLSVQKTTSDTQSESKDVKALSGGERSYTTMALLVALGETLETPFRILDEFDVFMDAETRKLVIRSLIHIAKKLHHRQFIFITPQDLSGINADDQVRILRLNPPDRHRNAGGLSQQVLPFAAATQN